MRSYDYDAVTYDGEVYCVECLPDGVNVEDPEVMPIFADSEWAYVPVCSVCGAEHDYVTVIREEYTATTIKQQFSEIEHDDISEAHIGPYYLLLGWDASDPYNTGYYLEWRHENDDPDNDYNYDGDAIDGERGAPDWAQVAKIANSLLQ
jgi:hypothetical protein